jgi:hypothetical protein
MTDLAEIVGTAAPKHSNMGHTRRPLTRATYRRIFNDRVVAFDSEAPLMPLDTRQVADRIAVQLAFLSPHAEEAGLTQLAYLLELARLEAERQAKQHSS